MVAVNVDKDHALAGDFISEFRPAFPIVFDSQGQLAQQYKIMGMPSSVIIDRDGKTRFTHTGFRNDQRQLIESEIRSLLN